MVVMGAMAPAEAAVPDAVRDAVVAVGRVVPGVWVARAALIPALDADKTALVAVDQTVAVVVVAVLGVNLPVVEVADQTAEAAVLVVVVAVLPVPEPVLMVV